MVMVIVMVMVMIRWIILLYEGDNDVMMMVMMMMMVAALAENPIRTKSHIWDFGRQYGIMFVIIDIIIIKYREVKVSTM